MEKYNGIIDEILYYSERSEDGRWIIPIEVDWDYTLTKCSSWEKGTMELNEEGFEVMKRWSKEYNVGWILNTMRHDEILQEPLQILKDKGIELYGVRKNPKQEEGEVSKVFAVFCIDDRNIGTPHQWLEGCTRPHVDWKKVDIIMRPILEHISNTLKKVVL
jgi:hypothetical protein